jgi:hypothetical protein
MRARSDEGAGAIVSGTTHKPLKVFCSYSHRDEHYLDVLKTWLVSLERDGLIEQWHDRMISPGQEWDKAIAENLETADMILLLVTPYFMASQYIYDKEMNQAVENHQQGKARVIPIMLRPSPPLTGTPLGKLQALPKDGKPITTWANQDQAWLDVLTGIQQAVQELLFKSPASGSGDSSEQVYRKAVESAWTDGVLHTRDLERLGDLAGEIQLSMASASAIEREVMGDTKEAILERQERAGREKERQERLEKLYTRARELHQDREWQAVVEVFEVIHTDDPVYSDPEGLLQSARQALKVAEEHQNALRQYHQAVTLLWVDGDLSRHEAEKLRELADELSVSSSNAAAIEREVMGNTKEEILDSRERAAEEQERKEQYLSAVQEAWTDHTLSEAQVERLSTLASDLRLSTDAAADIERAVMGDTIGAILQGQTGELNEGQSHLAGLYDRARDLYQSSEGLLKSASDALELRKRLTPMYEQGMRHMEAEEWRKALESFEEIHRLEPGYRETEKLLSQVRHELTQPTDFISGLARVCAKYVGPAYYVDEAITEEQLVNARSSFPIPAIERVVALLDVTEDESSRYGLAICEGSIRWCNDRKSSGGLLYRRWHSTQRGSLPWSGFVDTHIEKHPGHKLVSIEIGENNLFFMPRNIVQFQFGILYGDLQFAIAPNDLIRLLLDLQSFLKASFKKQQENK